MVAGAAVVLTLVAGAMPGSLAAQAGANESQKLRQAAALESVGDYDQAERVLREVLEANPASTGGLFALERVLRAAGRIEEILEPVDRFLEVDPRAAGPWYLKLRVLVETGDTGRLQEEGWAWIDVDPESVDPYREVARVFERALGPDEALAVLARGLEHTDSPESLALEVGDLRLRAGDPQGAAREWARAVGPAGEQGSALLRRVSQLQGGREEVVTPLVELLGSDDRTVAQRRLAAQLALEGGLQDEAIALSESVVDELDPPAARAFLTDLARRAEDRRADRLALWAYDSLRSTSTTDSEVRALNLRIAETALILGDTARAVEARRAAVGDLPEGSPERRRTLAQVIRLEAGRETVDTDELRRSLARYRSEFPEAPELDALAAEVSTRLQAEGDMEGAVAVLDGVQGPRSALERAFLSLDSEDPRAARADLLQSLDGLSADRATEVIALAQLLGAATLEGSQLAAGATLMSHRGDPRGAVTLIREGRADLGGEEQAGLLALGGRIAATSGDPVSAVDLYTALIEEFPAAPETPEAMMGIATIWAQDPGTVDDAARMLEDLILSRPNNPIVPSARRELDRIRRGVTGS
jgi:tetratricopeptide (TPR) repeat protein